MSENKPLLGRDLMLVETKFDQQLRVGTQENPQLGVDLGVSQSGDLAIISDELNLGQAIVHRLRTIPGELLDIGHSTYGSHLYDVIGEPNNDATRERARAIVRQALEREPRVKRVLSITVRPNRKESDSTDIEPFGIDIEVNVMAIDTNVPLNIVFPFHLEVA